MTKYSVTQFIQKHLCDEYALSVAYYETCRAADKARLDLSKIEYIILGKRFYSEEISIDIRYVKGRTMSMGLLLTLYAVMQKSEIGKLFNDESSLLFQSLTNSKQEKIQFVEILWHAPELMQLPIFRNIIAVIRSYLNGQGYNEEAARYVMEHNPRPTAHNEKAYFAELADPEDHDYYRPILGNSFYNFKKAALVKYSQKQLDGVVEGITEIICNNAFLGCRKLEQIILHEKVEYIGNTAIACCDKLKTITFENPHTRFGLFPIVECPCLQSIIVPNDSIDYYKEKLPFYASIIKGEDDCQEVDEVVTEETEAVDDTLIELTFELIDAAKTSKGGYTKSQLAAVGIGWPPPPKHIWQKNLEGKRITKEQFEVFNAHVYCTSSQSNVSNEMVVAEVREDEESGYEPRTLEYYKRKFSSLHTAIVKGKKAPHKALLLMAVMEAAEDECYECTPDILLDDELKTYFELCFEQSGLQGNKPNICMPFFHMRNESFWKLNYRDGYNNESQPTSYSVSALNKMIRGAIIDSELWQLMRNKESREELRKVLVDEYLTSDEELLMSKLVDKSLLYQGFTIPVAEHEKFYAHLTAPLKHGEQCKIKVWMDGKEYTCTLINQAFNQSTYADHKDVLQVRWTEKDEICQHIQQVFQQSKTYIDKERGKLVPGSKTVIRVPSDMQQFLEVYGTGTKLEFRFKGIQ